MRIEAGDFPKDTTITVVTLDARPVAVLKIPTGVPRQARAYVELNDDTVASFELVSDDTVKKTGGAVGGAILGGVLLGPVGAVGGAFLGGNTREVTFALELKDGRRMLAVVTPEEWTKIRNAMF